MVKEGSHCSCFQEPLNLVPWPRLTWVCIEIIMQFKCEEKWFTVYLPQIFMQGPLTSTLTPNKGKVMPCNALTAGLLLHGPRPLFPALSFSLDSIQDSVSSVYNLCLVYCRPRVFYTAILDIGGCYKWNFDSIPHKRPQFPTVYPHGEKATYGIFVHSVFCGGFCFFS